MIGSEDLIFKEKIAPIVLEAERSVLGCLLLEKDAIIKIVDFLVTSDFYHDHHRLIYECCLELYQKSQPVDLVTVATNLHSNGKLDLIGGPEFLAEIQNEVPTATHLFQYAQLIKHRATLRQLIITGKEINALGYDQEKSIEELLTAAEQRVFSISQTFLKDKFVSIKEILTKSYEKFCEIQADPDLAYKNRLSTPFQDLNSKLNGGFNASDFIILAARPSMGKTALCLEFAQYAAINNQKKVAIISLEMSKEQIVERMLCARLQVDSWKLHKGKLDERDLERMGSVMDELSNAPIFIDDMMGRSIIELRAKARRLQLEHGLDLLIIDYLQLMSGKNATNRVQEISEISRSLKQLARELHIPVIALSQLSRGVENRPDKRPMMSDLRDSGSIEQDADVIMMLYRDDYYNQESEEQNILEVNVIKHRNGAIGRVRLLFNRQKMFFADLSSQDQSGF